MLKRVRDVDLHLLRVFVAVAESGGVAAAQHSLNVAPSTISTQLSNLEDRLGFRLCERGRMGFSLTDEGKVVLEAAYQMFRDLRKFLDTMEALKGNLAGTLRIVLLDSAVQNPQMNLDDAISLVKDRHPFVQFEVYQLPPGELENAIIRREADIGVSWVYAAQSSLSSRRLFTERQVIFCGRRHPLFEEDGRQVTLERLETCDWVKRGLSPAGRVSLFLASGCDRQRLSHGKHRTFHFGRHSYWVPAGTLRGTLGLGRPDAAATGRSVWSPIVVSHAFPEGPK